MSYKKAEQILPAEVIALIQEYIDGEMVYIPRKADTRKQWGESTGIKDSLSHRNKQIYEAYQAGESSKSLADQYYLSVKSIQRIVGRFNKQSA